MSLSHPDGKRQRSACISADIYATLSIDPSSRQGFAYQRVGELIEQYAHSARNALDYGCGTGRSTRFLRGAGIGEVFGVDIDENMLSKALEHEAPNISYRLIESGVVPSADEEFDLSFSGIVLLEVPTLAEIKKIFEELKRVTSNEGVVMILTATKEGYVTDSDLFKCLLTSEQIGQLQDGDPILTIATANNQQFTDYYWSDQSLRQLFDEVGLSIMEASVPVPSAEQISASRGLTDKACYIIYVCEKANV